MPFMRSVVRLRCMYSRAKALLTRLMVEESGQDLIEYALVAALVGLGAVLAMKGLSNSVKTTFNGVGNSLTNSIS
jgi:pilus assembly protein Flp/PilA